MVWARLVLAHPTSEKVLGERGQWGPPNPPTLTEVNTELWVVRS
jgi:hypothetical protein